MEMAVVRTWPKHSPLRCLAAWPPGTRLQVLSCDPLRVFIFREGLARFCTEKYTKPKAENLSVAFMHLTNYAVGCLVTL